MAPRSGFAKAAGARLYFERRGQGAPLLMIPGGGGDCGFYSAIGDILASAYTVISYDRRGNSRSTLDAGPGSIKVAQQSEDAVAVLRENGCASALIFGTSAGATIALDIAARHPDVVEAVVPHEPPVPKILPDAAGILAAFDEIDRVLEVQGWEAAFKLFLATNRLTPPGEEVATRALLHPESVLPPGPLLDSLTRLSGNWEYMMRYEVRPFVDYVPDLDRITGSGVKVAPTSGVATRGQYFHRTSELIAERLGSDHHEFPGGHSGAAEVPVDYARSLRGLLAQLSARS